MDKAEPKGTVHVKKKRELLLGSLNKRKMSLRKNMVNIKQPECSLDISQITKCVFLGSLCLKPVPHLFDSPLMLEELDMTVEGIRSDIIMNNEVEPEPNLGSPICIEDYLPKPTKKRYLKPPKMRKSSPKEKSDTKSLLQVVKSEVSIDLKETEEVPSSTSQNASEYLDNSAVYVVNNNNDVSSEETTPIKQKVEDVDVNTVMVAPVRGPYDFDDDLDFAENVDYKAHRKRRTLLPPKPSSYVPQNVETSDPLAIDYEEVERLKREPTPELILTDSDEDAIDQLMFNIMDIKVGPNGFEKNLFEMPNADIEAFNEYSDGFEEKSVFKLKKLKKTKEKKSLKRSPQCKICSKIFPNYIQLKCHKKSHDGEKPYVCLQCNENCTTLDEFIAHLRRHQGKRPYLCKKCNKGFKTVRALEIHQPVHILQKSVPTKKPFKCETCGKDFRKLCDLERHTRVHTGEKPSVCNICNRRFQQAHNLNKHLLIHTNEKPFECDVCHKKFGRNDVLSRHLLTHSVKKPNRCSICMKTFIRNSQLQAHIEKYHQEQTS